MFHVWLGIWLASALAIVVPATLFTWGLIEFKGGLLGLILAGIIGWSSAISRACEVNQKQAYTPAGLSELLVKKIYPILAVMGVWLSVAAFSFPLTANVLFLYLLLAAGPAAFLSLLFFLRDA